MRRVHRKYLYCEATVFYGSDNICKNITTGSYIASIEHCHMEETDSRFWNIYDGHFAKLNVGSRFC
jgi:hypothetical protein